MVVARLLCFLGITVNNVLQQSHKAPVCLFSHTLINCTVLRIIIIVLLFIPNGCNYYHYRVYYTIAVIINIIMIRLTVSIQSGSRDMSWSEYRSCIAINYNYIIFVLYFVLLR